MSEEILGRALKDFANRDKVVIATKVHGKKKQVIAPIIGATKITHLVDAVGALSVKLTLEEVAYLEEPYVPHPIVGHE